jgi:GT2 family glycosyltransferase
MIMIFNNNPEYTVEIPGAVCINSQVNLGSSIRYAMAYATGAKYVIGHDDDLCLGKDDVQNLYTALLDHPESVIGFCGADMGAENPYLERKSYVAKSKQEVDVVLGRVNAMGRKCLSRYFDYVKNMGLSQFGNHEDIPLSLANKKAGFKNYIIPLDTCELPTGGVGLEFQEDHFTHRNELAKL